MFDLYHIYHAIYDTDPLVVCEIGVNEPDKCSLTRFIWDGIPTILVEPLPWCVDNLRKAFPKAKIYQGVCGNTDGMVRLYDRGEGSWIDQVPEGTAPDEHEKHSNIKRKEFDPKFTRQVRSFSFKSIDPGNIDVLCIDTEGAEWFALNEMISCPKLVRLETHFIPSGWRNPFYSEIQAYMDNHGYLKLGEDVSDSLYAYPEHT